MMPPVPKPDDPPELEDLDSGVEEKKVVAWRFCVGVEAGLAQPDAELLAYSQADLDAFRRLVKTGCRPETALRILT